MDGLTTLTVETQTFPPTSTKRALEEEQQSPRIECSPKRNRVAEDGASVEVTHFIEISEIFFSRLPHTSEKVATIFLTSHLFFV